MRVAITGGIAEGKSTVLGYLREAGYSTCSADDLAREVLDSEVVRAQVAQLIGEPHPSRDMVRRAIEAQPSMRRGLNKITHKAILHKILEGDEVFVEIPLLIETCIQNYFERVWVVTCGEEEQLKRLEARYSKEETMLMMRTQVPTKAKTPFADAIVRTNLEEQAVKRNVLEMAKKQLGDIRF